MEEVVNGVVEAVSKLPAQRGNDTIKVTVYISRDNGQGTDAIEIDVGELVAAASERTAVEDLKEKLNQVGVCLKTSECMRDFEARGDYDGLEKSEGE